MGSESGRNLPTTTVRSVGADLLECNAEVRGLFSLPQCNFVTAAFIFNLKGFRGRENFYFYISASNTRFSSSLCISVYQPQNRYSI